MKEGCASRTRLFAMAVVAPAAIALAAHVASAQSRKAPPAPPAKGHAPVARPASRKAPPAADAGISAVPGPAPSPIAPAGFSASGSGAGDAGVVEARSLDGGTRVFKFSELDIEGRLKSPQLVYFLRRVRGEFSAEDLGHRTFLREMSETRKESSF